MSAANASYYVIYGGYTDLAGLYHYTEFAFDLQYGFSSYSNDTYGYQNTFYYAGSNARYGFSESEYKRIGGGYYYFSSHDYSPGSGSYGYSSGIYNFRESYTTSDYRVGHQYSLTLDTAYGASYGVYGRYYHPGTNYYGAYKVTAYYSAYNGAYVAPPSYYLGYKVYY